MDKLKYDKRKFIAVFCVAMVLFAGIRHGFSINIPVLEAAAKAERQRAEDERLKAEDERQKAEVEKQRAEDERLKAEVERQKAEDERQKAEDENIRAKDEGLKANNPLPKPSSQLRNHGHKVVGVWSWVDCFPDSQSVQIVAAEKNGIKPCKTRDDAQRMISHHKLVNICNSPYYIVDDLTHSMPYLVPKAQHILNTICLNFIDSLQIKGIPPHLPMISSVFRTTDDVATLQRGNKNATTNSCHCYGTTVDITYNRFAPLTGHYDPEAELKRWDLPMKMVMAEVLQDLREQGLIYVKYERKQGCFHLTVR